MAETSWFYIRNGQQAGPISEPQLQAALASGEIQPTELVWRDGMPNWAPAQTIPGLVPEHRRSGQFSAPPAPAAPVNYYAHQPAMQQVPSYLPQSIIVTVLCCLPFGIPAIVYAAQVNSKLAINDYQGALESSAKAKMWCWIAFGLGLGSTLLVILMQVLVVIGTAR